MKTIKLAYSPDTDDAFMIEPLRLGLISTLGFAFDFYMDDIQRLNEAAQKGTYDITAISIAAYPAISDKYLLMSAGASIGDGWGPAIVVREDSPITDVKDLKDKLIAIPGRMTSAHFAARAVLPPFRSRFMLFSDIEAAVLNKEVDAGILIHELQMDVHGHGLVKLTDLGALWKQTHHLPLPLGANAIKRDLPPETIKILNSIYRASIQYALRHRTAILYRARDKARPELSNEEADRYIKMYVNEHSLSLDKDVKNAIKILYDAGENLGLCDKVNFEQSIVE